jgi:hypothetical protein
VKVVTVLLFSARSEDADEVRAALDQVVEHCDEHPAIKQAGWFSAPGKEGKTTEFLWLEGYNSREEKEAEEYNDACAAVWTPVKSRAVEGTWTVCVFDRGRFVERD